MYNKIIGFGQVYTHCKELGHIASVWDMKKCTIILRAIMKLSSINTQNPPLIQHPRVFSSIREKVCPEIMQYYAGLRNRTYFCSYGCDQEGI